MVRPVVPVLRGVADPSGVCRTESHYTQDAEAVLYFGEYILLLQFQNNLIDRSQG